MPCVITFDLLAVSLMYKPKVLLGKRSLNATQWAPMQSSLSENDTMFASVSVNESARSLSDLIPPPHTGLCRHSKSRKRYIIFHRPAHPHVREQEAATNFLFYKVCEPIRNGLSCVSCPVR